MIGSLFLFILKVDQEEFQVDFILIMQSYQLRHAYSNVEVALKVLIIVIMELAKPIFHYSQQRLEKEKSVFQMIKIIQVTYIIVQLKILRNVIILASSVLYMTN